MLILGIDPMAKGALAWLEGSDLIRLQDMPVVKVAENKFELDLSGLWAELCENHATRAYIEKMQALPPNKGGTQSNFKRGGYLYAFRALCTAAGIPLVEVPPKQWQKIFGIKGGGETDTKGLSYLAAGRLFPDAELKTKRGKILDGRSDALLIAEYGRRAENGR